MTEKIKFVCPYCKQYVGHVIVDGGKKEGEKG